MDFPQELIDEIISLIPQNDQQSFQNCSLVAKSWVYPARRRIFRAVDISGPESLEVWLDKIPPTNIEILQHVRSLRCEIAKPVDLLRDYFPSLCQLERLVLCSGFLPSPIQIGTYAPFQRTLSYLSLQCCSVTASALVNFVNCFPNLAHLDLVDLCHMVNAQPVPLFSRPLKNLSVTEFTDLGLIDQLMGLHPQCEEVNVDMRWGSCPLLTQHVINGAGPSVKRLNIRCELMGASNVSKFL